MNIILSQYRIRRLGVCMQIICPYCRQLTVSKKGKVRRKHRTQQRYYCSTCTKTFVHSLVRHKSYPVSVVRDALCLYHQGFSLDATVTRLNARYKLNTTRSTVHRWVTEYNNVCTYAPLRETVLKQHGADIIVSKTFEHHGLAYNFKYHTGKLQLLCDRLPSLAAYIIRCHQGCPGFFTTIQHRCSQHPVQVTAPVAHHTNTLLCRQTALATSAYPTKHRRHPMAETFLLLNDDVTVAVEVPVWLYEKSLQMSIAGHIDLIQIDKGLVYIMDYKPDAASEKKQHVTSQLYLYASGLSFRAQLPLSRIRCAWFDDKDYYEFEPKKAQVRYLTDRQTKRTDKTSSDEYARS